MDQLNIVARIHSSFPTKFGIPRQSGIVEGLKATVVFEPEYRNPDALRGLEDFSHIWLIWGFSGMEQKSWSPTVRPPRLGGNVRMGVFATRSPNRPNPIGLSCVEIKSIEQHPTLGPVIHVLGADLMDQTPIYDIKPYLPYADCRPQATGGFADTSPGPSLQVELDSQWDHLLTTAQAELLREILSHDPRPRYQRDPKRIYGMEFDGLEVQFTVEEETLTVRNIEEKRHGKSPENHRIK